MMKLNNVVTTVKVSVVIASDTHYALNLCFAPILSHFEAAEWKTRYIKFILNKVVIYTFIENQLIFHTLSYTIAVLMY